MKVPKQQRGRDFAVAQQLATQCPISSSISCTTLYAALASAAQTSQLCQPFVRDSEYVLNVVWRATGSSDCKR